MPGFILNASGTGFLLTASGGGQLLSVAPDPVAPDDATLYEIDRVENAFKTIMQNALPGMEVDTKRNLTTSKSPRVEIVFTAQAVEGRRYLGRFPAYGSFAPAQPLNTWLYTLQFTIVTNRNNNLSGFTHGRTVGIVRQQCQYYSLLTTLSSSILPYHAITSIQETSPQEDTVNNEQDLDETRLNFSGAMNIRDSAWPPL